MRVSTPFLAIGLFLFTGTTLLAEEQNQQWQANQAGYEEASIFDPLLGYSEQIDDFRYRERSRFNLWIPPVGYEASSGSVNGAEYQRECGQVETSDFEVYPSNCLSSVMVKGKGAYRATVNIFDNTGKFLHSHVQEFGKCGELDNPSRRDEQGRVISWLIWNQRENQNYQLVGSGAYLWKVLFQYENGEVYTGHFTQGIARTSQNFGDSQVCQAN